MKNLLKTAIALAMACGLSVEAATWAYYGAGSAGNPVDVACVTDGNWIFQVDAWRDSSFTTVRSANGGCLAGSGVLDLSETTAQLGRAWNFNGGWNGSKWGSAFSGNASITEVILPAEMTSICTYAFQNCSALTKVTVPSGFLTSIGGSGFAGCKKLTTFDPVSAPSDRCASYGSYALQNCSALHIPMKWNVDGNVSVELQGTGVTELDFLNVTGKISLNGYSNASITNIIWNATCTTYASAGGVANTVCFPGVVPSDSTFSATESAKKEYRVFCDPQMDSAWLNNPTFGRTWNAVADADVTKYASTFNTTEEEARANVIGWYDNNYSHRVWLVRWKSPLNAGGFPFASKVSRPEVGSVTVVPAKDRFEEGEHVSITANPSSGYAFAYWRGTLPAGIDANSASLDVTISGACDMEAVITNTLGWTHRGATDDEPELVTDGNWAFKVKRWNEDEDYFVTVRGTQGGYICGEGTLDLRDSAAQLGRRWKLEGGWENLEHSGSFAGIIKINETILPREMTVIPGHLFRDCKTLTKVTVPSGYLTAIEYSAFSGCTLLREFVPASAASGRCATYGDNAFTDCPLDVPMKWTLNGDLHIGAAFVRARFSSLDMGGVLGSFIYSGYSYSVPSNTVWGPNMTTFVYFGNERTITFTGKVPETNLSDSRAEPYRVYCDPEMDENWCVETVAGVPFSRPTDAQRARFVAKFGEAEVSKLISVSANEAIYLVKRISPYRRGGMLMILR